MRKSIPLSSHVFLVAILFILQSLQSSNALNVGKRVIKCTTLPNNPNTAILSPVYNIPTLTAFTGAQATLPSLGKCPIDVQYQVPWYIGDGGNGLCPPNYWNLISLLPGLVLFGIALMLRNYACNNRLVISDSSLGLISMGNGDNDISESSVKTLVNFSDVEDWSCSAVGLRIKCKALSSDGDSDDVYLPPFWNVKDVEALLNDRF